MAHGKENKTKSNALSITCAKLNGSLINLPPTHTHTVL